MKDSYMTRTDGMLAAIMALQMENSYIKTGLAILAFCLLIISALEMLIEIKNK
jgi:hypothetical protein